MYTVKAMATRRLIRPHGLSKPAIPIDVFDIVGDILVKAQLSSHAYVQE